MGITKSSTALLCFCLVQWSFVSVVYGLAPVLHGIRDQFACNWNIILICTAAAKNAEFYWYYNDIDLTNRLNKGGRHRTSSNENSQFLTIDNAKLSDTGTYYCSVDNSTKSNGFECKVIAPPVVVAEGNKTVFATQSATLSVTVSYGGNTSIVVIWSKCLDTTDTIKVDNYWKIDQFRKARLPLENVTTSDAGCYNVSGDTHLYQFFTLTWLFVIDYLSPPVNVTAWISNSFEIEVNWEISEMDEALRNELQGYRIFYRCIAEEPNSWKQETLYGNMTHAKLQLTDLGFPVCTLDIEVAAFSSKLQSDRIPIASPLVIQCPLSAADDAYKFYTKFKKITTVIQGKEAELCIERNLSTTEKFHLCNAIARVHVAVTRSDAYKGGALYWTFVNFSTFDRLLTIHPCLHESCNGYLIAELCGDWLRPKSHDKGNDLTASEIVGIAVAVAASILVGVGLLAAVSIWWRGRRGVYNICEEEGNRGRRTEGGMQSHSKPVETYQNGMSDNEENRRTDQKQQGASLELATHNLIQKVDGLSSEFHEFRGQMDDFTADVDTMKILASRTHDIVSDQAAQQVLKRSDSRF